MTGLERINPAPNTIIATPPSKKQSVLFVPDCVWVDSIISVAIPFLLFAID